MRDLITETAYVAAPQRPSATRLYGVPLALARVAWFAIVGITVFLYILSIVISTTRPITVCSTPPCDPSQLTPSEAQRLLQQGLSLDLLNAFYTTTDILFELVFVAVAIVIFWRKSDDWMAMLVALMLVTFSIATFSDSLSKVAAAYPALGAVSGVISQVGAFSLFLFFFLFPDGRFVPRWTRWLFLLVLGLGVVDAIFPGSPFGGNGLGLFIGLGSILFVQIYRYARVSGTVQRQQTKWVVFGTSLAFGGFGALVLVLSLIGVNPEASRAPNVFLAMGVNAAFRILLAMIPLSLLVAILRYRLWEIDVLINRTLVYVPLTAILAGIFAASITLSQKLFVALTGEKSDVATVLTTLIVVAAFDPLKLGLQHLVDRRFKEGRDPAKQLNTFNAQVQDEVGVIDRLRLTRRLLREAVAAFEALGGAAYLGEDDEARLIGSAGDWTGNARLVVSLQWDGQTLGRIELAPRKRGDDYSAKDREALQKSTLVVAQALAEQTGEVKK